MLKPDENQEEDNLDINEEDDGNSNNDIENKTADEANSWANDDEKSFKQRYSDSSRENTNIRDTFSAYRSVLQDNEKLLDLKPEMWKAVVKQLFADGYSNTEDYDELVSIIKWEDNNDSDDDWTLNTDDLRKQIRQEIKDENNATEAQWILDKALEKFDDDKKELFLSEFNEIAWDRKLTPAFVKREIEKIIVYSNRTKTKSDKNDDALSKLASNKLWGSKTKSSTNMTTAKLDAMWMPSNRQRTLYPELFPKLK